MRMFKMCSIHDSKAMAWSVPISFQAAGQAIRAFSDQVNNPESDFGRHPEDYSLFVVGEFDEQSGNVVSVVPEVLATGVNLVNNGKVVD